MFGRDVDIVNPSLIVFDLMLEADIASRWRRLAVVVVPFGGPTTVGFKCSVAHPRPCLTVFQLLARVAVVNTYIPEAENAGKCHCSAEAI